MLKLKRVELQGFKSFCERTELRFNGEGIAVLLVEQNVVQSLELAERAYVLDNGAFTLQGSAAAIRNDPDLHRAYLGM